MAFSITDRNRDIFSALMRGESIAEGFFKIIFYKKCGLAL